ncbi:hypothetical protein BwSH12_77960 [Bradyrhizobium ottawaense]|nr:hypothetical protein BwSH12_77960 [Bradyrhizobium ottawaense]
MRLENTESLLRQREWFADFVGFGRKSLVSQALLRDWCRFVW